MLLVVKSLLQVSHQDQALWPIEVLVFRLAQDPLFLQSWNQNHYQQLHNSHCNLQNQIHSSTKHLNSSSHSYFVLFQVPLCMLQTFQIHDRILSNNHISCTIHLPVLFFITVVVLVEMPYTLFHKVTKR